MGCRVYNLDKQIKDLSTDVRVKYSALFNNSMCSIGAETYLMTYRINYQGVKAYLTDPDSVLHPMNFWDKERYENGVLKMQPTKFTALLGNEYSDVAKQIDNNRFLGTGVAVLVYANGGFTVRETSVLFKKYGYHDVRVQHETMGDKSRLTFYYTKNNYGNLDPDQQRSAGQRWPRAAGTNKHLDLYYLTTVDDFKQAFAGRSRTPSDQEFRIKTFMGVVRHEYVTGNLNLDTLVSDINLQLERSHELCNIHVNTFIERNWIPTHSEMIYPAGSFFYGINGTNIIITHPSAEARDYDIQEIGPQLQKGAENTMYFGDVPFLRKMKAYINSFIDKETFYYKYKRYENVLNFSLSTNFVKIGVNRFLSVGHCKIDYQFALDVHSGLSSGSSEEMSRFIFNLVKKVDENTRIQNNYIYTMFFFEVDERGSFTRISDMFIPNGNGIFNSYINFRASQLEPEKSSEYFTNNTNNNPYLLVFPVGLVLSADGAKAFISYGEGDCRPKILEVPVAKIQTMLEDVHTKTSISFEYIEDDRAPDLSSICTIIPDVCKNNSRFRSLKSDNYQRHITDRVQNNTRKGGRRVRRTRRRRGVIPA